jgi:hypothetical protein
MTDTPSPTFADLVADVDVLAVVDTILTRPRHGSMSASLAAIVAMAERIRDLDAVAAGAAELLAQVRVMHREGTQAFLSTPDFEAVIGALVIALTALGYVQPTAELPPRIQGDDT